MMMLVDQSDVDTNPPIKQDLHIHEGEFIAKVFILLILFSSFSLLVYQYTSVDS